MKTKTTKPGSSLLFVSPGLLPSRREKRVQLILDAVVKCIHELGIEGTNYGSVGKASRMLRAHVAYYFPDWDELIKQTIRYVYGELQKRVVETLMKARTPKERLENYLSLYYDWQDEKPDHSQTVLLFLAYSSTRKEYRKLHTEVRDVGRLRIKELIEQYWGSTKGLSDVDLEEVALQVQDLLTGNLLHRFTTNEKITLAHSKQRTIRGVHALLESYANRP